MKKKLRPLGDIMCDMEKYLSEMALDHRMQWHEILYLIYGYLKTHFQDGQETYADGSHPEFYGPPRKKLTK